MQYNSCNMSLNNKEADDYIYNHFEKVDNSYYNISKRCDRKCKMQITIADGTIQNLRCNKILDTPKLEKLELHILQECNARTLFLCTIINSKESSKKSRTKMPSKEINDLVLLIIMLIIIICLHR